MIEAVLFDLDGTLIDSAGDLSAALNAILKEDGKPPVPLEDIRPYVSKGARVMIQYAYDCDVKSEFCEQQWKRLVTHYRQNLAQHSDLFTGMDTVLAKLEERNIPWGIVTNKPGFLTDPLVAELGFDRRAACVISGDTLEHSKPHPAPVLHACELVGIAAEKCVFIGDDERDIIAGKKAGTATLAAAYGYIVPEDNAKNWNADAIVHTPLEILDWLDQQ